MQTITNINQLRESLTENYSLLKTKEMSVDLGKELANTAGKILKSCKLELDYHVLLQDKKKIDFLDY